MQLSETMMQHNNTKWVFVPLNLDFIKFPYIAVDHMELIWLEAILSIGAYIVFTITYSDAMLGK